MKKYVNRLLDAVKRSKEIYQRVFDESHSGVYLYGAGFVGRWTIDYFKGQNIPILGVIDSDPRRIGEVFEGQYIITDDVNQIAKEHPIIISSRHAVYGITKKINERTNPIISIDSFVVHKEYLPELERLETLFRADTKSLETFRAVLLSMILGHTEPLTEYADHSPFFSRYDFFNRDGEVFVDAGAYVGDSVERFIWSVNGAFREIHAFEPGLPQYRALNLRLTRLINEWAIKPESVKINHAALSDHNGYSRIERRDEHIRTRIGVSVDTLHDSAVDKIKNITLDTYFSHNSLSLLKVDVEGSEEALVGGGAKVIVRDKPRIALSVYHYPTDLLRLTLQIATINPDYTFTLGHHSTQLMDTVLYCRTKYG